MVGSLLVLVVLAGAALALARPSHAEDAAVEVTIRDDRFTDSRLTIPAGTTVTWTHKGNNSHTVSPLDGDWESGPLTRGESFSYTFPEPGTYPYLCRQHLLQGMRGTITVE